MLVSNILKSKGDGVHTATPEMAVSEAAGILGARKIGALIVTSAEGRVAGVLSERDIVRALGERGADCLSDKVGDMMTPDPVCAALGDTDAQLLERMTEGRFRHMPVLEEGRLVGIVTLGDVVKARLSELALENESMQGMIMGR
ncbi:CBS domain-containing protein [Roseovarius aquimarinus]|uniref:CBS domain-containing protein n=1 Tax=Roseovarius aquimarinus TaxID=1229156 RepID=A0ABW7I302_9RHOB